LFYLTNTCRSNGEQGIEKIVSQILKNNSGNIFFVSQQGTLPMNKPSDRLNNFKTFFTNSI